MNIKRLEELIESAEDQCVQYISEDGELCYTTFTLVRIKELLESEHELLCLQSAGVDNWSGYDYACELMQEEE